MTLVRVRDAKLSLLPDSVVKMRSSILPTASGVVSSFTRRAGGVPPSSGGSGPGGGLDADTESWCADGGNQYSSSQSALSVAKIPDSSVEDPLIALSKYR